MTMTDRRGNLAEPNACIICGEPKLGHGQQWHNIAGWHTWIQPADAAILRRMKYRRGLTP